MKWLAHKKTWLSVLVLLMLIYPFVVGESGYYMSLFVLIAVFIITSMAMNLLIGYGGQMSIGHSAFLTIGAYSVAILATKLDIPFLLAFPLSGIITGIIGFVIGLPAIRLSGHFLAVATLGFALSIPQIALNWGSMTGGYAGLVVSRPSWLSTDLQFFYVVVVMLVLITWLIHNIVKSRVGRAFVAIRESEVAAQATGINIGFYKTMMFVISAFFTGLAGGLYGYWYSYVSPTDFTVNTSFLLLAMIVVGGLASIPGSIIGAILFTVLPELTASFTGMTNIVIGLAVVIIIFFRPQGIVSLFKGSSHRTEDETNLEVPAGSENEERRDAVNANL